MSMKFDFNYIYKKVREKIKNSASNTYQSLFKKSGDLTRENLLAILERHNKPSDFLNYREYFEVPLDENTPDIVLGVYKLKDDRLGLIYKLNNGGYPNEKTQEKIEALLESIISANQSNNLHFNFTSFSSQNIDDIIDDYKRIHHCNANIRNKHVLKTLVDAEIKHLKKWTKESSLNIFDYRVRNIVNLFSVIFPVNTKIDDIKTIHNLFIGSASDLNPNIVNGKHFIEIINEMFNIDTEEYKQVLNNKQTINKLVSPPGTSIDVNKGRVTFNKNSNPTYADVFSVASYPEDTTIFSTVNAFFDIMRKQLNNPLPCPFVNSVTIIVKDVEKKRDKYLDKARWDYERLSGIGVKDKKKEPELDERNTETKDIIEKLSKDKKYFVDVIWNLTVLEVDPQKLTKYGRQIVDSFSKKGWKIVRESFDNVALLKMFYTLPLQDDKHVYKLLNRTVPLLIEDVAKIVPIISCNIGHGKPYVIYLDPSGQIQTFDPMHSLTNYNIIVTGVSGGGKSYAIAMFLFSMLAAGTKIRMIDVGKSYARLCIVFGGQYIEFSKDSNYCLNFFTNVPTEERTIIDENGKKVKIEVIEKVNAQNIISIIGIMAGINFLDVGDDKLSLEEKYLKGKIQQAVNDAFRYRGGKKADLKDVHEFLKTYRDEEKTSNNITISSSLDKLIGAMYNFADPEGQYFSFFNGPSNLKFDSDFIILELDELKDLKDLYPIVVFMLAQFSFNEFFIEYHKNPTKRSLFGVDEAPMMFDNEVIVDLLEAFYRRIRKYNGLALTAAQNIPDFDVNKSTRAMFGNAAWRIINKVGKDEFRKAIANKLISPSAIEIQLVESIAPNPPHYGEMILKSESSLMVSRIKSNPYNHFILSQRESDLLIIESAKRQYGLDDIEGRLFVAIYQDKKDDGVKPEKVIDYIKHLQDEKNNNE